MSTCNFVKNFRAAKELKPTKVLPERKEYDPQAKVIGSPTTKVDNDVEQCVKADRDTVGAANPPTFWAMEIARIIHDVPGADAKAAYDNVIEDAKSKGLSDSQKEAIDGLLLYWRIAIPGLKAPKGDNGQHHKYFPVESDSTIKFPQHQVAAALKFKNEQRAAANKLLTACRHYSSNKSQLTTAALKVDMDRNINRLLKARFAREDIVQDMVHWNFPDEMKRTAAKHLVPQRVALSNHKHIALSNDIAKNWGKRQAAALVQIADHSIPATVGLSEEQRLRLSALKSKYELATPWWIKGQRKSTPFDEVVQELQANGYKAQGKPAEGGKVTFQAPDGTHTVAVSPSTTSFKSTKDPVIEYSFGTTFDNVAKFINRLPNFAQMVSKEKEEQQAAETAATPATPRVKPPSIRGRIKQLVSEGLDKYKVIDKLREEMPHINRSSLTRHWHSTYPKPKDIKAMARLEDGRVLTATIKPDGSFTHTTRFDYNLKKAVRKACSLEDGWVTWLRSAQFAQQPGSVFGATINCEGCGSPVTEGDAINGYCPACVDKFIEQEKAGSGRAAQNSGDKGDGAGEISSQEIPAVKTNPVDELESPTRDGDPMKPTPTDEEILNWARLQASDYIDGATGEVNETHLAEEVADHFGHPEWLADETHYVWDAALEASENCPGALSPNRGLGNENASEEADHESQDENQP